MRLATIALDQAHGGGTRAAVQRGAQWRLLDAPDVGSLLAATDGELGGAVDGADGVAIPDAEINFATLVPAPSKVLCVGLNYREHILEMGRDLPEYPTLFAKFADTLTGPNADIEAVPEDPELDWEGELVVVIGKAGRRIAAADAAGHIAGYAIGNDISMRAWQFRTKEWLQGKAWEASTPVGPALVTADELDLATAQLQTLVNDQVMQRHAIADLVFSPETLVSYASTMTILRPGDLIFTGTPGGVGRARKPPVYLGAGDQVEVSIDGIGKIRSRVVAGM